MSDKISLAAMAVWKRIGEQHEFKEVWEKLENAERSYIVGDIYNIIKEVMPDKTCKTYTNMASVFKDVGYTHRFSSGFHRGGDYDD